MWLPTSPGAWQCGVRGVSWTPPWAWTAGPPAPWAADSMPAWPTRCPASGAGASPSLWTVKATSRWVGGWAQGPGAGVAGPRDTHSFSSAQSTGHRVAAGLTASVDGEQLHVALEARRQRGHHGLGLGLHHGLSALLGTVPAQFWVSDPPHGCTPATSVFLQLQGSPHALVPATSLTLPRSRPTPSGPSHPAWPLP